MIDATYELIKTAKEGNQESQNEFIEKNKGLVHLVAGKFVNRGTDLEDLMQLGMIGLIKAMKNFDFNYDVKFSTYAVPVIAGEIKRFLRDDGIIKISRNIKDLSAKIMKAHEEYEKEYLCAPSISEISELLSVSEEDIILALNSRERVASLYERAGSEDDSLLLLDKIEDKSTESQEKLIDKIALKELLSELKPRERQVIIFRYFKEFTQEKISKIIGVSQVQVCRIEKKVLEKLKNKLQE